MSSVAFQSGQEELTYIQQSAAAAGLDPKAVLAVATHEGVTLPAEVGDGGTSFGPWQLHAGGALPQYVWQRGPDYAQAWANSPAGIDYALQGIRKAVGGATSGAAEIQAQVYKFEKPTDKPGETQASIQTYLQGGVPSVDQGAVASAGLGGPGTQQTVGTTAIPNYTPGSSTAQPAGLFSGITSSVESLILRGFEIGFGALLIGLGFYGIFQALMKSGVGTSLVGAATTVAAPATKALPKKTTPSKRPQTSRQNTSGQPISQSSARTRRRAGFELAADRKPRRGEPGSKRLAKGDTIPF